MDKQNLPTISICMATLNAERVLKKSLESVAIQNYPKEKIELIIGDGGSVDGTKRLVESYGGKVFHNPLKTGESGKSVAVKQANNELVLILDSDNFLPDENWLRRMVEPFNDEQILLSEPLSYTWRKDGGYIERYSALIGMNDPLCLFLGNYDRCNYLTRKWTGVKHQKENKGSYLKIKLTKEGVPTIGANGTIFRRDFLTKLDFGDYLFDIDLIYKEIIEKGFIYVAKVKVGIIHTFCESDFIKFIRKQQRRIKDYTFHKKNKNRLFDWSKYDIGGRETLKLVKFILYTLLVFPVLGQSFIGFFRKKDLAWFFHVPACWITLVVYGWGKVVGVFKQEEMKRDKWKQ